MTTTMRRYRRRVVCGILLAPFWLPPFAIAMQVFDPPIQAVPGGGADVASDAGTIVTIGKGSTPALVSTVRSTDGGATWTAGGSIDTGGPEVALPRIATDGAGTWVAVWMQHEYPDFDVWAARSTDDGVSWSAAVPVHADAATDSDWDGDPDVAADGAGSWIVAWNRSGSILTARSTDGGSTWQPFTALDDDPADHAVSVHPKVVGDGGGTIVAVWERNQNLYPGPFGTDADILSSTTTDGGATWSAPAAVNADALTDGSERDEDVDLATDGAGTWVAVWHRMGDDILAARSVDAGQTWTPFATVYAGHLLDGNDGARVATDGSVWVTTWSSVYGNLGVYYGVYGPPFMARSIDAGTTWSTPVVVDKALSTLPYGVIVPFASAPGQWIGFFAASPASLVARGVSPCDQSPRLGCKQPAAGRLRMQRNATVSKNTLDWKWLRGDATAFAELGDPTAGTPYALCLYDDNDMLVTAAAAAGDCGTTSCWKPKGPVGFGYTDTIDPPHGLTKVSVKSGSAGKTKAQATVRGSGLTLPWMPSPPLNLPYRMQLQTDAGTCWESIFTTPIVSAQNR